MSSISDRPTLGPGRIFDTLLYGQFRVEALRAAIELGVFSAIGAGAHDADAIGTACGAAPRGIVALCDFLTVDGYLTRSGEHYDLGDEARVFLDRRSPAYVGDITGFVCAPSMREAVANLTESVRRGGSPDASVLQPDFEGWRRFAESMLPVAAPVAAETAERLGVAEAGALRVLDIAAGHGEYGIAIARRNAGAHIDALDWPVVVEVARARAVAAGVGERYRAIEGDAFEIALDGLYDLILVPNLLHHFAPGECERLIAKLRAALSPGGRVATIEFVPNDDRVSPPWPGMFGLLMLATTPAGRTYTFADLAAMFERAGFARSAAVALDPTPQTLVVSYAT